MLKVALPKKLCVFPTEKVVFPTDNRPHADVVFRHEDTEEAREELWGRATSGHESRSSHIVADFELNFLLKFTVR
jgi:hypothetical protein